MKKRPRPFRTRIAKDIVAEVLFPERQTGKVAVIASGLPSGPNKNPLLRFLASEGYVAVFPRYRGSWESSGFFLQYSPEKDIRDVINELSRKRFFFNIGTGEREKFRLKEFHLFGASFGGPAVLLNAEQNKVKKVIALAPVLDWKIEGEAEPFESLLRFIELGFPGAYRTRKSSDWRKLQKDYFYNPLHSSKKIPGEKIFILHASDDTVVPSKTIPQFVLKTNATFYLKPKGGHLGLTHITHRFFWKKIEVFLSH